jgi:peptidoglycan/xylan/chitin deacetylase (PgdA/CDA1 family)
MKKSFCSLLPYSLIIVSGLFLFSCGEGDTAKNTRVPMHDKPDAKPVEKVQVSSTVADAATIIARKQVPVLCYHQIREWRASDSKVARDYIVPPAVFRQQIKMLADSGYHSILPDQLVDYLKYGTPLPEKPVMLTFDDTDLSQYTDALPELDKAGFKGVFFIMTVSLNRPGYMSREQVKALSDQGHVIGSHTWDHQNVKKLKEEKEWQTQIEKPNRQLQEITGKQVKYFAYPFGLWDPHSVGEIKKRGFTAAFQLSIKRDDQEPMFTIRRIIVPGQWSINGFDRAIKSSFQGIKKPETMTSVAKK